MAVTIANHIPEISPQTLMWKGPITNDKLLPIAAGSSTDVFEFDEPGKTEGRSSSVVLVKYLNSQDSGRLGTRPQSFSVLKLQSKRYATPAARTSHKGLQECYHETLLGSKPHDQQKVEARMSMTDQMLVFIRPIKRRSEIVHHGIFGAANPRTLERGQRCNVSQRLVSRHLVIPSCLEGQFVKTHQTFGLRVIGIPEVVSIPAGKL
ncbi:hypothetical protein DFJ58DRAFT_841432 [Suillus subalutaceus]|uniref:uncharacterized protein n=1 Tax=Suillus subalutaceus TaxID=48586 RepID=UPI001B8818DE|nr:uncharacterized protein DFJ58DRAFT_841432 [Suillus subalutaceus]KAG1854162.1 hypothetical protein DFJ58DRAFT_841432 [Suillus subalutaceus]